MRKKRIIISVITAVCVLVCSFFVMRFGVIGRIYDTVNKLTFAIIARPAKKEAPEELKYETLHDKDGNEVVIEYRKQIVTDLETGEEVEMWAETKEPIIIYFNMYKGEIEKIEDNKIYFMVDKEDKSNFGVSFKDVEDYQVVFDINTYDLEEDPYADYSVCDHLAFDYKDFYSADSLEFLVGKYLGVQESMFEDYYTGDRYKALGFCLK